VNNLPIIKVKDILPDDDDIAVNCWLDFGTFKMFYSPAEPESWVEILKNLPYEGPINGGGVVFGRTEDVRIIK